MENFLNMLDSQLVLFVYLGIGIYMRKVGMIDDNTRLKWIDFIIKISLPCMVFSSFNEEFNLHTLKTTGIVFLLSLFVSALSLLLGNVLFRRYRAEKASILKYATLVNNSGFLGLPLIESVYGATGLLYASIHIIPNRIMMWTAGISVFTKADMKTKIKKYSAESGDYCDLSWDSKKAFRNFAASFFGDFHIQGRRCHFSPVHDCHRKHAGGSGTQETFGRGNYLFFRHSIGAAADFDIVRLQGFRDGRSDNGSCRDSDGDAGGIDDGTAGKQIRCG